VFLSLNLKLPIFAGYLALMPVILSVNFLLLHCFKASYPKPIKWVHWYIAEPYMFTGPFLMLTLFIMPLSVGCLLEWRYYEVGNTLQGVSFAASVLVGCVILAYVALTWAVVA
jgi:hypothetical protein